MRIRDGFKLRKICGADVVIAIGVEHVDFSKIISLNESAAWLWKQVEGKEFDVDMLVSLLRTRYAVEEEVARQDIADLLESWLEVNIISK